VRLPGPLLALLLATTAGAVEVQGQARLWAGPGLDSNARRDFVSPGVPTVPDGFLFGLGQLDGVLRGEKGGVTGSYDVSARKFLFLGTEDTVIQSAQLEGTLFAGRVLSLGLLARGRDRRGANRDYSDLEADAVVEYVPDPKLSVRLRGGAHRFLYWKRFTYSFFGPDATLTTSYRFDRRWSLTAFGNLNLRTYNDVTKPDPLDPKPPPTATRKDNLVAAGVSATYRGRFQASLGYSFSDQASNSYGESQNHHRLSGTLGLRTPFKATLLVSGTLVFSQYPDGVYLSPDLQVLEDNENASSLTVKLVRPLTKHVELDARYAFYYAILPQRSWQFVRHVGSLGLSVTF